MVDYANLATSHKIAYKTEVDQILTTNSTLLEDIHHKHTELLASKDSALNQIDLDMVNKYERLVQDTATQIENYDNIEIKLNELNPT